MAEPGARLLGLADCPTREPGGHEKARRQGGTGSMMHDAARKPKEHGVQAIRNRLRHRQTVKLSDLLVLLRVFAQPCGIDWPRLHIVLDLTLSAGIVVEQALLIIQTDDLADRLATPKLPPPHPPPL